MYWASVLPLCIATMMMGVSKISSRNFFLVTAAGLVPGVLIYTIAGKKLGEVNSFLEIFSPGVLIAFGALVSFSIGMFLWVKFKRVD